MKSISESLANQLGVAAAAKGITVTTAESCTGGGIASAITDVSGSSGWFEQGFVTYSNQAKIDMLHVGAELILEHGAVSAEVVAAMALGALGLTGADLSVAVSGIAGPTGGSADKPVGTVYFAWAGDGKILRAEQHVFHGGRAEVRGQSVLCALRGFIELINTV